MTSSKKVMILGGLALIVLGMVFGLWYALFAEHQQLDEIGQQLTTGFALAAERKMPDSHSAIHSYAAAHYNYVRHVDLHSHWGGLAILLIVLGVAFHRVGFDERKRHVLAVGLLLGAFLFPLGVILETIDRGPLPQVLAVFGSALVIGTLATIAVGFIREADSRQL
jgi:dipeptide/tripeptide permease